MSSNDSFALTRNFEVWRAKRFPDPAKMGEAWEYYVMTQYARQYDLGDSQLQSGLVDDGQDGGVDGFYVLANGELVDLETEIAPQETPSFDLLIVQVKSDAGFSPTEIQKFYWFIDDLLDLQKKKADYHTAYHDDLLALMRLFKSNFSIVVGENPPINIHFVYAIKKDVRENADCARAAEEVKKQCRAHLSQAKPTFTFANAAEIWGKVKSRPPNRKSLAWVQQPLKTTEGYVGLVGLSDFYQFLRADDGKIEERFFDSNVRGYWPKSPINNSIASTLRAETAPEFWLLNNGVTILTEKIGFGGSGTHAIEIHDPQIVNGLQTSRQIYHHFSSTKINSDDHRRVLVRVIQSNDNKTRDEVIRCTNSQNEMPQEALRATDTIHRLLEDVFSSDQLFYDRRKGHYRDKEAPADKIVGVIEVLQAMLAIVLQKPQEARGRPRDYVRDNEKYNSVFGENRFNLNLYLKATTITRLVRAYLASIDLKAIHRRNLLFYVSMYLSCEQISAGYPITAKIEKIDTGKITSSAMASAYRNVSKQYERLANKHKSDDGENGYDLIARGYGDHLVAALLKDLRKKFPVGAK